MQRREHHPSLYDQYEDLWSLMNRGLTGIAAYQKLRDRVDALVDEACPQFAPGAPEVEEDEVGHSFRELYAAIAK